MELRVSTSAVFTYILLPLLLPCLPQMHAFDVGIRGTRCNLDPQHGEINDPCSSLYNAICVAQKCKCPTGTHEDKALKTCKPGAGPAGSGRGSVSAPGGAFDDLPFDFDPNQPGGKPAGTPSGPGGKPPVDKGQNVPLQPRPGYSPDQPRYNPDQPGYKPDQPGYKPDPPGSGKGSGGDPYLGEKAGGGTGGILGFLLLGALIYFCCCRGKGKGVGGKFADIPFIGVNRGGPNNAPPMDGGQGAYPMSNLDQQIVQQQQPYGPPQQQPYGPPPQQPYGPQPQQPYGPGYPGGAPPGAGQQPPPMAFYPGQQQPPPPYAPQYQPGV